MSGKTSSKAKAPSVTPALPEGQALADWLQNVRFKKALIGGVQESDVWKKLAQLEELYQAALAAERVRYDTLLQAQARSTTPAEEERPGL